MSNLIKVVDLEEEKELKDVRVFFEIDKAFSHGKVESLEESVLSLFSLSEFKIFEDGKHKIVLKSLNHGVIPNISITLSYFYKRIHKQIENNDYVGFYKLIKSLDLNEGDIIDLGFESNTTFGISETPLEIEEISQEVTFVPSIEKANFEKAILSKEVFDKVMSEGEYIRKYEKLDVDWFDSVISNLL